MLAAVVAEHGGNWDSSRMARLGGQFAGMALVRFEGDAGGEGFTNAIAALAERGLRVNIEPAETTQTTDTADEPRLLSLELVGNDRPGILAEISRVLAAHEVNVEELGTACEEAPMAGGELFRLRALLAATSSCVTTKLEADLEAISAELMVEVELTE